MKKIFLTIMILIVVAVVGTAAYLKLGLPDVGDAPDLKVEMTPDRIKRGEYLANHVTVCVDCHSDRDWNKFSGPIVPNTQGKGGQYFGRDMGFPGDFYSKNITPFHLQNWTDGEMYRVITTGVSKDGVAIFPVMPYGNYRKLATEDVYSIIAYVRTLKPIENVPHERSLDFPMNFILNTIPEVADPQPLPAKTDTIAYGSYLVNAAACIECHTKVDKGQIIPELAFGGGRQFQMPNGLLTSANITPDNTTGIGQWTSEMFVARFKAYTDSSHYQTEVADKVNTIMPWTMFGGMDSLDLVAIYKYLRTVKPIKNKVEHFQLAKKEG